MNQFDMFKNSQGTTKKVRENDKILGINVNSTTTPSVLAGVEDRISCSNKFYIVTPNPELILASQTNENLKKALNSADISVPDGVGLKIADPSLNIIKGRELFLELIKLSDKKSWKVFLLGGLDDEGVLAAKKISADYPKLLIMVDKGPKLGKSAKPITDSEKKIESEVTNKINKFAPQLLFVAFGNPKQEIWIHENLSKLNIGGAMTVGGTFRYIAGTSKLPPKWMAEIGLEWFWRLITEPARFGRVFRAVIVYPIKYFFYKISH